MRCPSLARHPSKSSSSCYYIIRDSIDSADIDCNLPPKMAGRNSDDDDDDANYNDDNYNYNDGRYFRRADGSLRWLASFRPRSRSRSRRGRELEEGHPRPRLRSPPPPPRPQSDDDDDQEQTLESDDSRQRREGGEEKNENEEEEEDDPNKDPTTATNTASNTNIPTNLDITNPLPALTYEELHSLHHSENLKRIYSHSRRAPPRPRQPLPRSLWNIIPVPSWRQRARAHSRSKRTSRSAPPHTSNDSIYDDPEYLAFDAAKYVRPPPRRVKSVPRASERAARVPTPPSILKESVPPRRPDFPLPPPTDAERNWRHTITRIPTAVADAVLKERPSVDFDKKSRVHGYFKTDPIYLIENTTTTTTTTPLQPSQSQPQSPTTPTTSIKTSPPPSSFKQYFYYSSPSPASPASPTSPSHHQIPYHSSSTPNLFDTAASITAAIDRESVQAFSDQGNQKKNLQGNYTSLFEEFEGEDLPPPTPTRERRNHPPGPTPSLWNPLTPEQNYNPFRPPGTTLARKKARQPLAFGYSHGESSSSSKKNKPKKPNKKKKDPKDGGNENKRKGDP
ncbi:hypothetical protein TWF718_007063 [Orbilia javanica]|uniref:Uncharacterized protein n=1 Tax=Orbilia javanica TaxID=47235 RepID=A0AAN8N297_9PEZI